MDYDKTRNMHLTPWVVNNFYMGIGVSPMYIESWILYRTRERQIVLEGEGRG